MKNLYGNDPMFFHEPSSVFESLLKCNGDSPSESLLTNLRIYENMENPTPTASDHRGVLCCSLSSISFFQLFVRK